MSGGVGGVRSDAAPILIPIVMWLVCLLFPFASFQVHF